MSQQSSYLNRSSITEDDNLIYDSSISKDISFEEIQTIMNCIREFLRGEITEDQVFDQISDIQITFRSASLFDQYFFGQSGSLWREAYNRPSSGTFFTFSPLMVDNFDNDDESTTFSNQILENSHDVF
jgi:hypothetical protein